MPVKDEVETKVLARYIATGEKQVYCDKCRREAAKEKR